MVARQRSSGVHRQAQVPVRERGLAGRRVTLFSLSGEMMRVLMPMPACDEEMPVTLLGRGACSA